MTNGRIPPHDLTAEESLLGSMLVSADAIEMVREEEIDASAFYSPAHQAVFAAIMDLRDHFQASDHVSVSARLEAMGKLRMVGGREAVAALLLASTLHPREYLAIITGYAYCRRVISIAERITDAAYQADLDTVHDLILELEEYTMEHGTIAPSTEASELAVENAEVDWVIPGLLARQETVVFVAQGGLGKTTLMRQMAATTASGLHPFTRVPMKSRRVLTFDFQDPIGPAVRATRRMLDAAGDAYQKTWWVELRREGVDLTRGRDQAWFEAKVASVNPDLIFCGPLYNMVAGATGRSKQSEETAEIAGRFLVKIMVKYGCAIIAEAHSPHGDEQRVRGSKFWEDWAAFGFGLVQDPRIDTHRELIIQRFRWDRETDRQWPKRFVEGRGRWPWDATGMPVRSADPDYPDDELGF